MQKIGIKIFHGFAKAVPKYFSDRYGRFFRQGVQTAVTAVFTALETLEGSYLG